MINKKNTSVKMNNSSTNTNNRSNWWVKSICYLLISSHLCVVATKEPPKKHVNQPPQRIASHQDETMSILSDIEQTVVKALGWFGNRANSTKEKASFRLYADQLAEQLKPLNHFTQKFEVQISKTDLNNKYSKRINQRNQKILNRLSDLTTLLTKAANSVTKIHFRRAINKLQTLLTNIKAVGSLPVHNTEQMPFGSLNKVAKKPATTLEVLSQRLGNQSTAQTLQANLVQDPNDPVLISPTIDAPQDEVIQNLASSLNHDPVAMYNWVYNQVEFVPSYGSMQGASYTAELKRGNAFDQASLLLALYRASGIPAHYVFGTVRLPIEQAMNWVGGVETSEALQNLMSQGGIPNSLISTSQNPLGYIQFEHIWIKAWGSFKTDTGQLTNQWLAMDPSFKQYTYTQNLISPFSVKENAITELMSTANIDETQGWISNVNQNLLTQQLQTFTVEISTGLNATQPNATVAEILGSKTIVKRSSNELFGNLPYTNIISSTALLEISDSLRHKFKVELQDALGLNALVSIETNTVELAGKAMTLSFTPSSETEQQILFDYVTANSNNGEIVGEFPVGLINVVAKIALDKNVISSGGNMILGEQLQTEMGFWSPLSGWETSLSPIIAGEYQAIGVDLQGVTSKQLVTLQNQLQQTKANLESGQLDGITKHELTGDILSTGITSYLSITRSQGELLAGMADIVSYRMPSYGTLSTTLNLNLIFGVPSSVTSDGFTIDVDSLKNSSESATNCWNDWFEYNQRNGTIISVFEHMMPENLFTIADEIPSSVSAVKALALAEQQGQKIYTFDQSNAELMDSIQIDEIAMPEITTAINSGKLVTVHEQPLVIGQWSGSGYIITDPETGGGAYKIVGGANGGAIFVDELKLLLKSGLRALIAISIDGIDSPRGKTLITWLSQLSTFNLSPILAILNSSVAYANTASQALSLKINHASEFYCELSVYQFSVGMSFLVTSLFPAPIAASFVSVMSITFEDAYQQCSVSN